METSLDKRHGAKDVVASKVSVLSVVAMFYAICCAGAFGIEEMIPECGPGLTIVMLLVLALAEKPEQMLPASCRTVLLDKATAALFATAGNYGTALLGKMQLSALAEAPLKQMDSAHLELVVRGFAEHYLVHIQNRGWLGAVFALPGMLLYLF